MTKVKAKKRKLLGRFIVADPQICHGKPTFVNTRIMLFQILGQIARGMTWDKIVAAWGDRITKEAIAEAVELANGSARKTGARSSDWFWIGALGHEGSGNNSVPSPLQSPDLLQPRFFEFLQTASMP